MPEIWRRKAAKHPLLFKTFEMQKQPEALSIVPRRSLPYVGRKGLAAANDFDAAAGLSAGAILGLPRGRRKLPT